MPRLGLLEAAGIVGVALARTSLGTRPVLCRGDQILIVIAALGALGALRIALRTLRGRLALALRAFGFDLFDESALPHADLPCCTDFIRSGAPDLELHPSAVVRAFDVLKSRPRGALTVINGRRGVGALADQSKHGKGAQKAWMHRHLK